MGFQKIIKKPVYGVITALVIIAVIIGGIFAIKTWSRYKALKNAEELLSRGEIENAEREFDRLNAGPKYEEKVKEAKKAKGESLKAESSKAFEAGYHDLCIKHAEKASKYCPLNETNLVQVNIAKYMIEREKTGVIFDNVDHQGGIYRLMVTSNPNEYTWYTPEGATTWRVIKENRIDIYENDNFVGFFEKRTEDKINTYFRYINWWTGETWNEPGPFLLSGSIGYEAFSAATDDWNLVRNLPHKP